MQQIPSSELILNPSGSVYHLDLLPHEIAPTIITVGDPERVEKVSRNFDRILFKKAKREFHTHTGELNGKLLTVISTGIGTDNIDIVFNELDALVNIDLEKRTFKEEKTVLNFIRIGTSGILQEDIPVDSYLASEYAVGLDGLLHYYDWPSLTATEQKILDDVGAVIPQPAYIGKGDPELINRFGSGFYKGITVTCAGFYGPQGRQLRLKPYSTDYLDTMRKFDWDGLRLTNFEMETAGIYGLANLLGHKAVSLNALIAQRAKGQFSKDPGGMIERLIRMVLEKI